MQNGVHCAFSGISVLNRFCQKIVCQRTGQRDVRAIQLKQHTLTRSSQQMDQGAGANALRIQRYPDRLVGLALQDVRMLASIQLGEGQGHTGGQDSLQVAEWARPVG